MKWQERPWHQLWSTVYNAFIIVGQIELGKFPYVCNGFSCLMLFLSACIVKMLNSTSEAWIYIVIITTSQPAKKLYSWTLHLEIGFNFEHENLYLIFFLWEGRNKGKEKGEQKEEGRKVGGGREEKTRKEKNTLYIVKNEVWKIKKTLSMEIIRSQCYQMYIDSNIK